MKEAAELLPKVHRLGLVRVSVRVSRAAVEGAPARAARIVAYRALALDPNAKPSPSPSPSPSPNPNPNLHPSPSPHLKPNQGAPVRARRDENARLLLGKPEPYP